MLSLILMMSRYISGLKMRPANMKSWKTTAFGALGALGVYLTSVKDPEWVSVIGQFVSAISTFGLGMVARDNDKSSETVGAK